MDIRETECHPFGWKEEGQTLVDCEGTVYPAHFVVCTCCEGRGSCVNPSVDSQGIGAEEFDEDPDFREHYMNGTFDISCPHCGRSRVVLYPSTPEGEKQYNEDQKAARQRGAGYRQCRYQTGDNTAYARQSHGSTSLQPYPPFDPNTSASKRPSV